MKRINGFSLELAEKRQRQENEFQTSRQLLHHPKDSKIYELDDRLRKVIIKLTTDSRYF